MKKWTTLLASTLLSISLTGCFEPLQVKQINDAAVPVNIHSANQVKQAIKIAAQGLNWKLTEQAGQLEAIKENSRQRMVVSIPYTDHGYKILFKDATNMGYNAKKNTINANYNNAVTELNNAIQVNLYAQ